MKNQRNTEQMKEQTRNTEVQINEEEIGKLPEKEFRIMIVKMVKKPWKQAEENARINKHRPRRIKEHSETNKTITEIKSTREGINTRISEAEEWMSELEDKMV